MVGDTLIIRGDSARLRERKFGKRDLISPLYDFFYLFA